MSSERDNPSAPKSARSLHQRRVVNFLAGLSTRAAGLYHLKKHWDVGCLRVKEECLNSKEDGEWDDLSG